MNAENTYTPKAKIYQNSFTTEIAIFYYKIYASKLVSTLNIKNSMNINIKTKKTEYLFYFNTINLIQKEIYYNKPKGKIQMTCNSFISSTLIYPFINIYNYFPKFKINK